MIDAHFHCWQLARKDYGWLTPELAPIYRDVAVADWMREAGPLGITGGVLVQAAPTQAETHFLLAQADAHPQVLGVVGWVDLLAPEAAVQVAALARHPRLKGLRPMLQDLPDPDWILQPALAPAIEAMARHGLVFDALVRPEHLSRIETLLGRHPGLRVVIDHGAKPSPGGDESAWQEGLRRIAQGHSPQRVACKLSGLWTQHAGPVDCSAVAPWCQALLAIWGPERLLWGSDWPVLELAGDYRRWHHWSLAFLEEHCTPQQQAQVLEGNARRLYRL